MAMGQVLEVHSQAFDFLWDQMGELVRDILAVVQKVLPFPEFQQKVQSYFTQFYAEAQQTA